LSIPWTQRTGYDAVDNAAAVAAAAGTVQFDQCTDRRVTDG